MLCVTVIISSQRRGEADSGGEDMIMEQEEEEEEGGRKGGKTADRVAEERSSILTGTGEEGRVGGYMNQLCN